jgi:single-strand DNA-binding protein
VANVNTVTVSGNIVADPELKFVGAEGDFAIANLRMAVNRDKKQQDGSYESVASFFDLTVLGKFAELVDRKVRKGDAITVSGRLEQQRWQNEAGENRSKVVIIVSDIDGAAMYRKADDVPAKENGEATAAPASKPAAAASDDDIPF